MISESSTAIIVKDNQVVLVKRASIPFKGWWALPGGRKEKDETFEQCVKREVLEETGLCIDNLTLFKSTTITNRYGKQYSTYYIVSPCSSEIKRQKDEIAEVRWFSMDSLPSHLVHFHKTAIDVFKEMKK